MLLQYNRETNTFVRSEVSGTQPESDVRLDFGDGNVVVIEAKQVLQGSDSSATTVSANVKDLDVFISYNHSDKLLAEEIYQKLLELVEQKQIERVNNKESFTAHPLNTAHPLKEIWERGDRAIATATGAAFLGGLVAQIPGAIAGAVFGILFGLFVRSKKPSLG